MDETLAWLLAGPSWVEYRTRRDLLDQPEGDPETAAARQAMLADPQVRTLVAELGNWPGTVISSHKSAGQPFHKLTFSADLGLRDGDPGVDAIIERILAHQSAQGPFALPMNIAPAYGGAGQQQWAWALCDAPLILYALLKFGLAGDSRVVTAGEHLVSLVRDNGWPCVVSPELGKWRGPGRKEDPCPFATLAMLKALAAAPAWRDDPAAAAAAAAGAQTLLALWAASHERHPYMFYMGTDFRKLKAPLVWYDLLHVLDVLTSFPWLHDDPRLAEMAALLASQADTQGRFTPGSVWQAWGGWEFGQKKNPISLVDAACLARLAPRRALGGPVVTIQAQRSILSGAGVGPPAQSKDAERSSHKAASFDCAARSNALLRSGCSL